MLYNLLQLSITLRIKSNILIAAYKIIHYLLSAAFLTSF